jgi:alkylation response protein AidB-like acyl-CoA dehydrogenase
MSTTAKLDGDHYILKGQKTWISLCDKAGHFIVFAYTDKSKKHHGISAFIVERTMEGFSSKAIKGKYGIRAGNTGEIFFDDIRVPVENRIGEEGEGFKIAMSALDNGRFTVAAGAAGLIKAYEIHEKHPWRNGKLVILRIKQRTTPCKYTGHMVIQMIIL